MLSIVFLVVGILLGYIIGFFITKSKNDAAIAKSKEENTVFKIKAESLNTQIEDLVKKEKEMQLKSLLDNQLSFPQGRR